MTRFQKESKLRKSYQNKKIMETDGIEVIKPIAKRYNNQPI